MQVGARKLWVRASVWGPVVEVKVGEQTLAVQTAAARTATLPQLASVPVVEAQKVHAASGQVLARAREVAFVASGWRTPPVLTVLVLLVLLVSDSQQVVERMEQVPVLSLRVAASLRLYCGGLYHSVLLSAACSSLVWASGSSLAETP